MAQIFDPNKFDPTKLPPEQAAKVSTSDAELKDILDQMQMQALMARYDKTFGYEPLGGGSALGGAAGALAKGMQGYGYGTERRANLKRQTDLWKTQQDATATYLRNMMQKKPDSDLTIVSEPYSPDDPAAPR